MFLIWCWDDEPKSDGSQQSHVDCASWTTLLMGFGRHNQEIKYLEVCELGQISEWLYWKKLKTECHKPSDTLPFCTVIPCDSLGLNISLQQMVWQIGRCWLTCWNHLQLSKLWKSQRLNQSASNLKITSKACQRVVYCCFVIRTAF